MLVILSLSVCVSLCIGIHQTSNCKHSQQNPASLFNQTSSVYSASSTDVNSMKFDSHFPQASPRNLQSVPSKLTIKLSSSAYKDQKLILTVQDGCTLSNGFECDRVSVSDPNYIPDQLKSPQRLQFINTPSYAYIEYSNTFSGPITLDITYLTSGGFLRQDYLESTIWKGTVTTQPISSLELSGYAGHISISFLGYFIGSKDGPVIFTIKNDDGVYIWIDEIEAYSYQTWDATRKPFTYSFVKDKYYYTKINLQNLGFKIELSLRWDFTDSNAAIPSNYLYYPTRIPGLPYMLSNLVYDTYCDDLDGFKCIVCDELCGTCEQISSKKVCIACIQYANLSLGVCECDIGYYESASDPKSCIACDGLCALCEVIIGLLQCNACLPNATLSSGVCQCNPGYYLSMSDPKICQACDELCEECEEISGLVYCKICRENTRLSLGRCECKPGLYTSVSDPKTCISCDGLCEECEEVSGFMVCKSCQDNARLSLGRCECNPEYYSPLTDSRSCMECPELCNRCGDYRGSIACTQCIENAIVDSERCVCKFGYYVSSSDDKVCKDCPEICEACEESEESAVCTVCREHAGLDAGTCKCHPGYYLSNSDQESCKDCPKLCKNCKEEAKCVECRDNASLSLGVCSCDDGFYTSSYDLGSCIPCMGPCKECEEDMKEYICTSCKVNSFMYLGECICNTGFYMSQENVNECTACPIECISCQELNQKVECIQKQSDTKYEILQNLLDSTSSASDISSWISLILSFLCLDINNAWRFLNTIQILTFLPLLQAPLPEPIFKTLIHKSKIEPILTFFSLKSYTGLAPYQKAQDFRYKHANFVGNSNQAMSSMSGILTLHMISWTLSRYSKGKLQTYSNKACKVFTRSVYLRFFMQMHIEIVSAALLNIIYVIFT